MYLLIYYIQYNKKELIDYQDFETEEGMNLFINLRKEDEKVSGIKFNVIKKYKIEKEID